MLILHIPASILVLFIVPTVLGLPWVHCALMQGRSLGEKLLFVYSIGWQEAFALFHIESMCTTFARIHFDISVGIYAGMTVLVMALSVLLYLRPVRGATPSPVRRPPISIRFRRALHEAAVSVRSNSVYTWIYIAIFAALLGFLVYHTLTDELGFWSWDDATYVAYGTDALKNNLTMLTDPYTGTYVTPYSYGWVQRAMQSISFYYAFLALITGLDVPTTVHTLMYTGILLLGFMSYGLLSYRFFRKKEDRFIFLILIAVVYLFGYTSQYSVTFRFLGPNWQGKALLAVLITPLLLYVLFYTMTEKHRVSSGLLILVLSTAASGMTLGGVYTIVAVLVSMVLFGIIRAKSATQLLYLLWGGIAPGILAAIYLHVRFFS